MTRMFDATGWSTSDAIGLIDDILRGSTEFSLVGTDLDGNITLWNEGARQLYGWDPEEVVGRANREILHTREEVASGLPKQILAAALDLGRWGTASSRA